MSAESEVMVALTTFVLLAPALMVAVLVRGLSTRPATSDEAGPDLERLLMSDGVVVPVQVDEH